MLPWVCHQSALLIDSYNCWYIHKGIKKSIKQDWIRIDRKYLDRMQRRRSLVDDHLKVCLGNNEISNLAMQKLYKEIILDLLPKRFTTMFGIDGDIFQNLAPGSRQSISAALTNHSAMLRHLATNVEEDFWFMVPNELNEFILQGFVARFSQGLLPSAKVGTSVSELHQPIPGYDGRLKRGVIRCFERIVRGQSVERTSTLPIPFLI